MEIKCDATNCKNNIDEECELSEIKLCLNGEYSQPECFNFEHETEDK